MDNVDLSFEIREAQDFVKVTALRLFTTEPKTDWDKNWIEVLIEIHASPFQGKFKGMMEAYDFEKLKQELRRLYNDLNGTTMFTNLERILEMKIKGDGLGHFEISGSAVDNSNPNMNRLTFNLSIDQTYLPDLINQLNAITKKFPIHGNYQIKSEY